MLKRESNLSAGPSGTWWTRDRADVPAPFHVYAIHGIRCHYSVIKGHYEIIKGSHGIVTVISESSSIIME
jgi:hypothetical protein